MITSDHQCPTCLGRHGSHERWCKSGNDLATEGAHDLWLAALHEHKLCETYSRGESEEETIGSICCAIATDLAAAKSAQAQAERDFVQASSDAQANASLLTDCQQRLIAAEHAALESAALVERMREALKDCAEGVLMLSHHLNGASDGPIASDVLGFDRVGPAQELYAITPSAALAEYTEKVWKDGCKNGFANGRFSEGVFNEILHREWGKSPACAALQKGGQS